MPSQSAIPDIPGLKVEYKTAQKLSSKVAGLLGREGRVGFPASQPVSFTAKHIQDLKRTDYYLSKKSDGTRCLIYCTHDDADNSREIHYLINRRNEYYIVENLHFPMPNDPSFQSFHAETLIDGELVLDDVGGGKVLMRYMGFDRLVLDGENMLYKTLDMRLAVSDVFLEISRWVCDASLLRELTAGP